MRLLPLFSKPRNDEFCGILVWEFRLGILDWNSNLGILFRNSRIPKLAQSFGVCASAVKIRLQDFIAIFALRAAALAMERRSGSVRRNFTIAFGALANKSK